MRIVVHGQQAFGKAVLEALIKRGEEVVAAYVAPEKPGAKADPLKEAALAAPWRAHRGGPGEGARLRRAGDRRDQGLGRDHRAGDRRQSGSGVIDGPSCAGKAR